METLQKFREAIAVAAALSADAMPEDRVEPDADICLTSRSAFYELFTIGVTQQTLSKDDERDLDESFREALRLVHTQTFREPIVSRYKDFLRFCRLAEKYPDRVGSAFLEGHDTSIHDIVS